MLALGHAYGCGGTHRPNRAGQPDSPAGGGTAGARSTDTSVAGSGESGSGGAATGAAGRSGASDAGVIEALPPDARARCLKRCAELEPDPSTDEMPVECGWPATVATCTDGCVEQLVGTDAPCSACVLERAVWPPEDGHCNDRECVCTGGFPEFPGLGRECSEPCADTLERMAQARLAQPVPEPEGRLPDALWEVAVPGGFSLDLAIAGGDPWLAYHDGAE